MQRIPILLIFLLSCRLNAQSDLEFSGYMMNLSSVQDGSPDNQDQRERVFTSTLTRIRLRPILYLSDNVRLVWEHEIDAAYSSQSLQAKSSSGSRQFVDLTWRPVREDNLQLSHFVDRAYLRVDFRHSNVVAGRQRIAWGVGRIWNPTDLFNPINPADFTKLEKDGADAVSAKWNIGSFTDVQAVVIPQEKPGRSHAGARFRSNVGETDWSVMTGYFDRRSVLGADAAGNFGGAGFRVEGALFSMTNSKKPDYLRAVAGVDYQFTSRWYGLAEFLFNGSGALRREKYDLISWQRGELLQLAREYIYLQSTYMLHPLIVLTLSSNSNLNDASGFAQTAVDYSALSWLQVGFGGIWFYGRTLSEYSYYSDALYIRATAYF